MTYYTVTEALKKILPSLLALQTSHLFFVFCAINLFFLTNLMFTDIDCTMAIQKFLTQSEKTHCRNGPQASSNYHLSCTQGLWDTGAYPSILTRTPWKSSHFITGCRLSLRTSNYNFTFSTFLYFVIGCF